MAAPRACLNLAPFFLPTTSDDGSSRERLVLTLGEKAMFKANLKPGFQGVMEWGKGCLNEHVIRLVDSDVVYIVE